MYKSWSENEQIYRAPEFVFGNERLRRVSHCAMRRYVASRVQLLVTVYRN